VSVLFGSTYQPRWILTASSFNSWRECYHGDPFRFIFQTYFSIALLPLPLPLTTTSITTLTTFILCPITIITSSQTYTFIKQRSRGVVHWPSLGKKKYPANRWQIETQWFLIIMFTERRERHQLFGGGHLYS